MRKKLFIPLWLVIIVFSQSCSEPTHPDSDNLCGCYKELYRAADDKMDAISDSCSAIHISILDKLKDNPEEKEKFETAYEACQ